MKIETLTNVIRGDSDSYWIVDKLLQKRQSILLSGRVADASLLALQIALDVAGGKPFVGEYQTCLGKVLFNTKDKNLIKEHAQTLARRPASTDNLTVAVLEPGDEKEIIRVMKIEQPTLTILGNFPGSLDLLQFMTLVGPVVAVAGIEWSGQQLVQDVWHLNATETGYKLDVKPHGISLLLSKQTGFVLESIQDYKPGSGPVWNTTKSVIRNQTIGGGIGISGMHSEQHWTS